MPRKRRFELIDFPQHIVQRGNNRSPVFFDVHDHRTYLDLLQRGISRYGGTLHAYVLMTNHIHLLLTPQRQYGLSKLMQWMGARYVEYINRRYQRTGTLWEGRFKAALVDTGRYVLSCYRYIELNPVRACMVENPAAYPWSSHRVNVAGEQSGLIDAHPEYASLGHDEHARRRAYRDLFAVSDLETENQEIRDALNQELAYGSAGFKDRVEAMTRRRTRRGKDGRPRKGLRRAIGESILTETRL